MHTVLFDMLSKFRRRSLRNRYFAARHLKSTANERGVIVSAEANGSRPEWGLVEAASEVLERTMHALDDYGGNWVVATSPFTRHWETAALIADRLKERHAPDEGVGIADPTVRLMAPMREFNERSFGRYEGTESSNYERVWVRDREDATQVVDAVESVVSVRDRMLDGLIALERQVDGRNVVIVSSADPLHILETAFRGMDPREHRSLKSLEPGEIRILELG